MVSGHRRRPCAFCCSCAITRFPLYWQPRPKRLWRARSVSSAPGYDFNSCCFYCVDCQVIHNDANVVCGGAMRIMACIEDSAVIEKILAHLDAKAAAAQPSRPPPCRHFASLWIERARPTKGRAGRFIRLILRLRLRRTRTPFRSRMPKRLPSLFFLPATIPGDCAACRPKCHHPSNLPLQFTHSVPTGACGASTRESAYGSILWSERVSSACARSGLHPGKNGSSNAP
jgi:hypothetical protein